ncbi:glucan 1,6-alpha-glucosidase [Vibrio ishigakensis]|uniref:Glucan 1,6-alpha-glucosidase n=1 Tax=Vibrio ishigakensis TaxID=1481914 RepID=A0A0B8Q3P6_9VIBR|nr:glucan 1,6-alpha-glucosidase [Vibrio ishigakensis]
MHFLKGTPYIYQGEEIGMTNVKFDFLDEYRDIETLNFYDVKTSAGISHEHMMDAIHTNSRDNSRTPMQWSAESQAGFTGGEPWIKVNPNYREINVADALSDKESIFYHYQRLIALRKQYPVIVYGDFIPVFEESDTIFAYIRQDNDHKILVINNFSDQEQKLPLPQQLQGISGESLVANYEAVSALDTYIELKPYESFAIKL